MNADLGAAKSIFLRASDLATHPERQAFVAAACGDDAALRREVEELLHHQRQLGSFLEATSDQGAALAEPTVTERPGTLIGPYKLLQHLGEGGMGTVFMAEQARPVQRKVALKIIKPGLDNRQVIARFEAERQALALMDHPNIAKVLEGGTTDAGRPYFVMELVKGVSLTKYCDDRQLTPRERLQLFIPVCQAVQHAHQKGIIHRDIKPSNVVVALYDDKPVPKVIDFGIAKATGQKLTERTMFTEFGQVIGTLEYMSPEQAGLNQLDVDTRSDLYSLGVLLYEMLTGTTPLEPNRLGTGALLECLRIIREEEPQKPSTRLSTTAELPAIATKRGSEPKKLSGLVRGDLDWIVMRCLEKDRNRRYETAHDLELDVQRFLNDEPVLARPPSVVYRCRKFVRRHMAVLRTALAAALVLLLTVVAIGWSLWDRAARRADTERAVSGALIKAEQLGDEAGRKPAVTSRQAGEALVVWRQAEDALAQAEAALSTGVAEDDLRQRVQALRQQIEQGHRQCKQQWEQAQRKEKLLIDLDDARLTQSRLVGNLNDLSGAAAKYAAAFAAYGLEVPGGDGAARRIATEEQEVREALILALDDWTAILRLMPRPADPAYELAMKLQALAQAADKDAWRQRFRVAARAWDRAALRDLSAKARRSSLPPASVQLLATNLMQVGERDEAINLLRWGRGRYPTDFWMHYLSGVSLAAHMGGKSPVVMEEAIGCYRAALALRPTASGVRYNLARALRSKHQPEEAIAEFRRVIDLDPTSVVGHYDLAITLRVNKQWDEASAEYRRVMELGPEFGWNFGVENALAQTLYRQGKTTEANAVLAKAIARDSAALQCDPTNPRPRQLKLRDFYWALADNAPLKHHELAKIAEEFPRLLPDDQDECVRAAWYYCRCASLVVEDDQLTADQRADLGRRYADRAVEMLKASIVKGNKDGNRLVIDPAFAPLRTRDDFQKLVAELKAKKP
jgi:serine/threonine protein kinase/tetratricopeptide (TPR) repeat protein